MNDSADRSLGSAYRSFSRAAGLIAALAGILVLAGWLFGNEFLKTVVPGGAPMRANSAGCFILCGAALWLMERESRGIARGIGQTCAALAALIGLATLAEYLFGIDLGIDQLLFREAPGPGGVHPGRMPLLAAVSFVLLGCALALLDAETRRGWRPAQLLALPAGLIAFFGTFDYVLGLKGSATGMALHGALLFGLLSLGVLLARPEKGLTAVLVSPRAGGMVVRRLVPSCVATLVVVGCLRWMGQRVGLYGTEFGVILVVTFAVALIAVLIWMNARALDRADEGRERTERKLQRLNRALRVVGECNQALLHATEESEFLQTICRNIVEIGGHRLAWVGYAEQDEAKTVRPVAQAGASAEFLDRATITWVDTERGRGPTGMAIRTGQPRIIHQALTDPSFAPWREQAASLGLASVIALPLVSNSKPFGVLSIYSSEPDAFDEEEGKSLTDLAVDLSFGITALRTRAERDRAQGELEAVNKELEAFTYSVSHDLRAPLRHMDGFARLLSEECSGELGSTAGHYLDRIQQGARQMGRLVDDLLNLARVGRQDLRRQATGLNSLVEEVLRELPPEARERSIEWRIARLPFVDGDPHLLKQVFMNLISNAIKFTRPRQQAVIEIGQAVKDGHTAVYVRDNGVGFSMKYRDKLFKVFQRLHRPEDFEGTGVGLATVQRIIHKHGGQVWAEGELDKGATFYFALEAGAADSIENRAAAPEGGAQ